MAPSSFKPILYSKIAFFSSSSKLNAAVLSNVNSPSWKLANLSSLAAFCTNETSVKIQIDMINPFLQGVNLLKVGGDSMAMPPTALDSECSFKCFYIEKREECIHEDFNQLLECFWRTDSGLNLEWTYSLEHQRAALCSLLPPKNTVSFWPRLEGYEANTILGLSMSETSGVILTTIYGEERNESKSMEEEQNTINSGEIKPKISS